VHEFQALRCQNQKLNKLDLLKTSESGSEEHRQEPGEKPLMQNKLEMRQYQKQLKMRKLIN
jgi:hypothetical protein